MSQPTRTALVRQHPHCPDPTCLAPLLEPSDLAAGFAGWVNTPCPLCDTWVLARYWTHQTGDPQLVVATEQTERRPTA